MYYRFVSVRHPTNNCNFNIIREEVEAFYKPCNLPNVPDGVDEFGDDEDFEDDKLLLKPKLLC